MNKKVLIKFCALVALVIVVILAWLLISSRESWKNNPQPTGPAGVNNNLTAQEAADWNAPFMREIKPEFADKEELKKMDVAEDPNFRIQILEKDANGNVIVYKKVYSDKDIIKYVYDPKGTSANIVSSTPITDNASQTPAVK